MMFDLWPVYSGERFRALWPSCFLFSIKVQDQADASIVGLTKSCVNIYQISSTYTIKFLQCF